MEDTPPGTALVANTDTLWRCLDFCPEGPFDDGEIMWHFELQQVETDKRFLVTISGPIEDGSAAVSALLGAAGLIGASIGSPVPGVSVNTSKPN